MREHEIIIDSFAGVVAAFLQSYYGTDQDTQLSQPLHTDTTKPRHGLVTVNVAGEPYVIVDIGMRMLTPRERFRAQGFPDSYVIDQGVNPDGSPHSLTLEAQGRACGNSVCPPLARALVAANCADMAVGRQFNLLDFAFGADEGLSYSSQYGLCE